MKALANLGRTMVLAWAMMLFEALFAIWARVRPAPRGAISYFRVECADAELDEVRVRYSETDRYWRELRTVHVYPDGWMRYASAGDSVGEARLGRAPPEAWTGVKASDSFRTAKITKAEFDMAWETAVADWRGPAHEDVVVAFPGP